MARLRGWLVWWLIVLLCVYSASSSALRVMGPRHWHAMAELPDQPLSPAAGPSGRLLTGLGAQIRHHAGLWLADVQHLANQVHARAHALGAAPHHHGHSALQRHWHDADDDTVRLPAGEPIDAELADLTATAALGGATLLPLLASHHLGLAPARANGRWPQDGAQAWRSALGAPALKPPIG